jgi:DNA mismatch endonuclease (patch repair protein)
VVVDDVPVDPELPEGSFASNLKVRRRMQRQRVRDTAPEIALRHELHRLGLRYRLDRQVVRGTRRRVDIVFGPTKVAVLVDGCFWHGCPEHGSHQPKVNTWYWPDKIAKNKERDADTDKRLRSDGWLVIRVWEHDDPIKAARRISRAVARRRAK